MRGMIEGEKQVLDLIDQLIFKKDYHSKIQEPTNDIYQKLKKDLTKVC